MEENLKNKFLEYMCTSNSNNIIPMRHLYKVLTTIALLYIQECLYFYMYDSKNKNQPRQDLAHDDIYKYIYDANLRFSKTDTDTLNCVNNLDKKDVEIVRIINQYLITSLELRRIYLSICKKYIKRKSVFDEHLSRLISAIHELLTKSQHYI